MFWIFDLSEYVLCDHNHDDRANDIGQIYSVLRCMKTKGTIVLVSVFAPLQYLSTVFLVQPGSRVCTCKCTDVYVTYRCEDETQSDYVSVTSHQVTDDNVTSGKRMCGAQYTDVEQVRSETNHLYIEFRSNEVFDATGFEAVYQFCSPVHGTTITGRGFGTVGI